tara:strand:- start:3090 stop:3194 length:105 start_codon:yes stop_codon:yes gene_type:complete
MDINLIKYNVKHYWKDHKKVMIGVAVVLVIAIIL